MAILKLHYVIDYDRHQIVFNCLKRLPFFSVMVCCSFMPNYKMCSIVFYTVGTLIDILTIKGKVQAKNFRFSMM